MKATDLAIGDKVYGTFLYSSDNTGEVIANDGKQITIKLDGVQRVSSSSASGRVLKLARNTKRISVKDLQKILDGKVPNVTASIQNTTLVNLAPPVKKLINTLKTQTTSLKKQYVAMTENWATSMIAINIQRRNRYEKSLPSDYASKRQYYEDQKWYHRAAPWYFTPEFIVRMKAEAEQHYEDSIIKLAARIEKKGLDQSKLKVITSHVGVNIETTLSDGVKTVRAFTIVASGPVQRPHYRYLIK